MTMKYLTIEQVQEAYPELSLERQNKLGESVDRLIDEYLDTSFEPLQHLEILDSQSYIRPSRIPIVSVESLSDNGVNLEKDVGYFVYKGHIKLVAPSGYNQAIEISYTHGYSSVPEMVKTVAEQILWFRALSKNPQVAKESFEEYSYELVDSPSVVKLLRQLRRYKNSGPRFRVGVI